MQRTFVKPLRKERRPKQTFLADRALLAETERATAWRFHL